MGASGKLQAVNDHLILELLKDPNYKVTDEGKIFTKLTLNGQGISDDWREMGYQKDDGYVRIRYKDNFLFADRVIYQNTHGDLKSDLVINHINLDNTDNRPKNLEQLTQHENNKKKHKKYKKAAIEKIKGVNMSSSLERVLNAYSEEKYVIAEADKFYSEVDLDLDESDLAILAKINKDSVDYVKTKKLKIKWTASFIYRDWGFNIQVSVPDQKIQVSYDAYVDSEKEETDEKEVTLDLKDISVEFKGHSGGRSEVGVVASELKVDGRGKHTLVFQSSAA